MAPTSGMLYHHHCSSVRLKCFEHVRHIRQVADVVAGIQQYRPSRRANMGAAAAQHYVLYGSRWVRLRQPNFAGLMLIVSAKGSGQATGTEYLIGVCLAMASAFFYAVAAAITKRLKDLPWAPMGITSKVLIGGGGHLVCRAR